MITSVKCPHCGEEVEITKALSHEAHGELAKEIEEKLRKEIEKDNNLELQDLQKVLSEKDKKLDEFRQNELELRKKTRELEEKEKDLEIEARRVIDREKQLIEESTAKKILDEHHLKDMEKDKRISDMERLIEELKRTSQQGSMQTQGEVAEIDFENTLKRLFPHDEITEVKKGELGGDVRQTVKTQMGTICGLILWERKRTKSWDEKWISKLKEDMSRDKAHLGAIITEVLPRDFQKAIGERRGVWITTSQFLEPLATLLRKVLYDVAKQKAVAVNKEGRAEELYDFITSHEFTQQVGRIMETYNEMAVQITKERAVAEKQWKIREMQVQKLVSGISGVYGSIKGLSGNDLPEVKSLELSD